VFSNLLPSSDSCVARRCSAMAVRSGLTIPAFSRHVTIYFNQINKYVRMITDDNYTYPLLVKYSGNWTL
jgi:hypothetical protein